MPRPTGCARGPTASRGGSERQAAGGVGPMLKSVRINMFRIPSRQGPAAVRTGRRWPTRAGGATVAFAKAIQRMGINNRRR